MTTSCYNFLKFPFGSPTYIFTCFEIHKDNVTIFEVNTLAFPLKSLRLDFFPVTQQPLVDQALLIIEASRSHCDTPYSVGLLWTSDQPDAETCAWQNSTLTRHIHAHGGIRTHNPSKRAVADPRLRACVNWDRLTMTGYARQNTVNRIGLKFSFTIAVLLSPFVRI